MLIRKPVSEVFEAIINPEIITKFWFTKSTGRLKKGETVTWTWEMYGVSTTAIVLEFEENKRILLEWGDPEEKTQVEWIFTEMAEGTFVEVSDSGYKGTSDEITNKLIDSTGGFTLVLAGMKSYLEHGINLHLIYDRHPNHRV